MDKTDDQLEIQVNRLMDKMTDTRSNTNELNTTNNFMNQVVLPWDKFNQWINSIVVVTFDIELGQSFEV
jgi:hypothetical protein